MTVLYSPPTLAGVVRTFLLCRTSRATIMRVRRTLTVTEIEKYGILKLKATDFQMRLSGREDQRMSAMMPIATSKMLVQSADASLWRTQTRTHRAKVHDGGDDDDPKVHRIGYVATIELEVSVLGASTRTQHKQGTNQKALRKPVVQEEHEIGDNTERHWANETLISKWSRG